MQWNAFVKVLVFALMGLWLLVISKHDLEGCKCSISALHIHNSFHQKISKHFTHRCNRIICPVVCVASPTSVIIILNHMPGSRVFPEVFYMGGIHVNRISGNLWMAHRILINCTVLKLAFKSLSHLLFKIANSVWDTFSMQYSYEYVINSIHYHSKK